MSIESLMEVSRAGLAYERVRMDAASRNIAGANVALKPGQDAMVWRVGADMPAETGVAAGAARQESSDVRSVQDPGHPYADADGNVRYPSIDLVRETTEMMTASRGYEANVRSFNLLRSMVLRALDIGGK